MSHAERNVTTSTATFILNMFLAVAALGFAAFLAVGAYHALIVLIAHGWSIFFSIFVPAAVLLLAVCVVTAAHPVHSLLALITVFFGTVLLYLASRAEFLAFIFLIVYVGAVSILFLFVIMLLDVKKLIAQSEKQRLLLPHWVAIITALVFAGGFSARFLSALSLFIAETNLLPLTAKGNTVQDLVYHVSYSFFDIHQFSTSLYTHYSALFMLISLLLLVAMIGAIVLASSTVDSEEA